MEHQEFNGIIFYQTEPNDYFRHSVKGTTILMHRYVWEYYNCPIPKGYHIHHKDGNKANNDISNLELLKGTEHYTLHGKLLTDEEREWRRQNVVKNAVPKATEWHKSEEGRAWHKEQVDSRKDNRKYRSLICCYCGNAFTTFSNKDRKFCSNRCKTAFSRAHNKDREERQCIVCGNMFLTDKYKKAQCCSPKCRATLGHRLKGE